MKRTGLACLLLAACAPPKGRHGYAHIDHLDYAVDRCQLEPVRSIFELSGDGTARIIRDPTGTRLDVRPARARRNQVWFYMCVDDPPLPWNAPSGDLRLLCRHATGRLRVTVHFACR